MNSYNDQADSVDLIKEESIVLCEFPCGFNHSDKLEIIDKSEKVALNNLLCALENVLDEPFHSKYQKILQIPEIKCASNNQTKSNQSLNGRRPRWFALFAHTLSSSP